jgi:hypothetical protein
MNQIVIDQSLEPFFDSLKAPTEICDRAGQVLGVFTPHPDVGLDFDLEEAERILERERDQGKTLEEVKGYLGSLDRRVNHEHTHGCDRNGLATGRVERTDRNP